MIGLKKLKRYETIRFKDSKEFQQQRNETR